MKCPNHLRTEAAGYCCVCGTFFCEACLTRHEGQVYCKRHYKPIAQKMERAQKHEEVKKRHGRHNLVVRYVDGRIEKGICFMLNPESSGFTLECVNAQGATLDKTVRIRFSELKALFTVKSFDGKFDKNERYSEYTPGGSNVFVKFKDGEVIEGATLQAYNPDATRFYMIPIDAKSNNITILIEGAAVEAVYTPEEYAQLEAKKPAKNEESVAPVTKDTTGIGQEESMGDFYFETRTYGTAQEQYLLALRSHPDSQRLKTKVAVASINIGIQHIKKREYPKALACMETALDSDPTNIHAKKKAKQLQKIIEKTERRMRAYAKQSERGGTSKTP